MAALQMGSSQIIDITLVSGRRPQLLRQTLASFHSRLFENFQIGTMFANIDPFCGTKEDGDNCEALVREYFPDANITRPNSQASVKR